MIRWLRYGYWAWPWDKGGLEGPFYYFIGLGVFSLWWERGAFGEFRRAWIEWNVE